MHPFPYLESGTRSPRGDIVRNYGYFVRCQSMASIAEGTLITRAPPPSRCLRALCILQGAMSACAVHPLRGYASVHCASCKGQCLRVLCIIQGAMSMCAVHPPRGYVHVCCASSKELCLHALCIPRGAMSTCELRIPQGAMSVCTLHPPGGS